MSDVDLTEERIDAVDVPPGTREIVFTWEHDRPKPSSLPKGTRRTILYVTDVDGSSSWDTTKILGYLTLLAQGGSSHRAILRSGVGDGDDEPKGQRDAQAGVDYAYAKTGSMSITANHASSGNLSIDQPHGIPSKIRVQVSHTDANASGAGKGDEPWWAGCKLKSLSVVAKIAASAAVDNGSHSASDETGASPEDVFNAISEGMVSRIRSTPAKRYTGPSGSVDEFMPEHVYRRIIASGNSPDPTNPQPWVPQHRNDFSRRWWDSWMASVVRWSGSISDKYREDVEALVGKINRDLPSFGVAFEADVDRSRVSLEGIGSSASQYWLTAYEEAARYSAIQDFRPAELLESFYDYATNLMLFDLIADLESGRRSNLVREYSRNG
jgi:hypothetical protein